MKNESWRVIALVVGILAVLAVAALVLLTRLDFDIPF